jgi:ceramide glucosyltransferase
MDPRWRYYSHPADFCESTDQQAAPEVTIIRPVKGLEPYLYDCLASTFLQSYPKHKLHIRLCISNRDDPAHPVLIRLLRDYPDADAKILVEEEDVPLQNETLNLGPNPKIRNMSRAYREAAQGKDDLIWIVDCNVWIGKHTCGRMVAQLSRNKFVHQLPLVVDTVGTTPSDETQSLLNGSSQIRSTSGPGEATMLTSQERSIWNIGGGRLEELFLASAHPKFYVAINTVAVAPCIIGKSSMFKRTHLDALTEGQGIDYFSFNICEDHLIGDVLWKQKVPEEVRGESLGKHVLCFGDLAIQPMSNMSIGEYWNRRVRWLRVRKFTVTLATLVEPGTESFVCSLYGAYAATALPFFNSIFGIPRTWVAFAAFWLLSVSAWCVLDWMLYQKLHSADSICVDEDTPVFARPPKGGRRRPFHEWLLAWLGREALALPIWVWAFWGGVTVEWRGKKFWVGTDMRVHEIQDGVDASSANGHMNGKARQD